MEFRRVRGFEKCYMVSDTGLIYSFHQKKILKPKLSKAGYLRVTLCDQGRQRPVAVHRVVAEAFIKNPENKPTVNHKNEIKTDNRVENLEWMTQAEQNAHGTRTKRAVAHTDYSARSRKIDYSVIAQKHDYARPDMCGRAKTAVYKDGMLIGVYQSQIEAARAANTTSGQISACLSGRQRTSHGYSFRRL